MFDFHQDLPPTPYVLKSKVTEFSNQPILVLTLFGYLKSLNLSVGCSLEIFPTGTLKLFYCFSCHLKDSIAQ